VVAPAELPVTINAYRQQQYRWARGSFECARLLIPRVLRARLPIGIKLQALLHLGGYGIHALMFTMALIYPIVAVLAQSEPSTVTLFGLAALFNLTALAPTMFFIQAQIEIQPGGWKRLPTILLLSVLGSGLMINNVRAIAHAFTDRSRVFERTPKFGLLGGLDGWQAKNYQLPVSGRLGLEIGMLLYNLNTLRLAIAYEQIAIGFYAAVFALGLLFILGLTAWQSLQASSIRARTWRLDGSWGLSHTRARPATDLHSRPLDEPHEAI
jgi:hypothetical protein